MRILFLLLLLLNLGYFTWQWQQQSDATAASTGGPIAVAPGTKTLTLLSEGGTTTDAAPATPRSDALQETPPAAGP